ncbi:GNAT family N-acetyltransferase [Ferrovum myxofaciens]|uniref:GNAT family N-acetyltransferase n=1 Tax=Ferrovum myxofaciens TaxID=416213 RepID=UPI0023547E71|nr:GNAT family N-acetyltransferase [Ferrovum myxofaciens]MBU6995851.1 GNAT family N-acetyltransferase [Ferrovum myxofaciens]
MIRLRPLVAEDMVIIEGWPSYQPDFDDLDYALRKDGWLEEFCDRPDIWRFAAERSGELVAFTILATTAPGEAEFRIALRSDKTGQGLGAIIAASTLERGFAEIGLARIHLVVRKNNPRAIRLYQRLGFTLRGECCKVVNWKLAHFFIMDLQRKDYLVRQRP